MKEALNSDAEPLASTSADVAEECHEDESGADGNPGSSQQDSAQPAEDVEPLELEDSWKVWLKANPWRSPYQ